MRSPDCRSSAANAGPKEDALAVVDKWTKAFAASDVDGIVKRYAPDALFVGTSSKAVVVKPEGIRSYFENGCSPTSPTARPSMIMRRWFCPIQPSSSQV
jgi:hypothetical protein